MEENICTTCIELNKIYKEMENEEDLLKKIKTGFRVYDLMEKMKEEGALTFYMSDTPFEKWREKIEEEMYYSYSLYMQCTNCKKVYELEICIRGTPRFKVHNVPPDKEEFKEMCKRLKRAYYL